MLSDYKRNFLRRGFTLTEIVVTIGILLLLFAFVSLNLSSSVRRPAQTGAYDILVSDIRAQQIKAMESASHYTIILAPDSYTLSPDGFVVDLPEGFEFTTTPTLTFSSGTGETTSTSISVRDTQSGESVDLRINKYGATY